MQFYYKNKHFSPIIKSIGLLILVLSICSFSLHKYYTSITRIEVDSEAQLLKMYSHVFVDDFERLLKDRYQLEIEDFSKISLQEKQQIEEYIIRKINIAVNRSPLKIVFLGCELENQLLYLYYEAPFKEELKRLDIENSLLMDLYTEQQNNVNVSFNNKVKSVHLTQHNSKQTLFF